jgi:nitrogen fixation-related uncharacterized protein
LTDWVTSLLKILKVVAIIMAMVAIFFIWTAVPDDEFYEQEDNHASEQS